MSTMTPEERMEVARVKLDAWLGDFAKLESPIDGALDDLGGFVDELTQFNAGIKCWLHGDVACKPCRELTTSELGTAYTALRELWEART